MKRLLSLLLLLIPSALMADDVTIDRAQRAAENFFGGVKTKSVSSVTLLNPQTTKSAGAQSYYIYAHTGGGFIIISGTDALSPVLAYSRTNDFIMEDIPSNVQWVLDEMKACVQHARKIGLKADSKTAAEWDNMDTEAAGKAYASEVRCPTAEWNQNAPFWNKCPKVGSKNTYTGCVATATAEIMRYHKWPSAGTGSLPSYSCKEVGTIPGHDLGHTYEWDSMPTVSYSDEPGQYNAKAKEQVAQLMYDVGVMCEMNYGTDGSGAYTSDAVAGLQKYMGYSPDTYVKSKDGYTKAAWISMIKESIDNDCPILYAGDHGNSGHAFVAEGYNSQDQIYINFGWGGSWNGWCTFPYFNDYSEGHEAAFNLRPYKGGDVPGPKAELTIKRLHTSTTTIQKNTSFTVIADTLSNHGGATFVGNVAIYRVDGNGNSIEQVKSYSISELMVNYFCPTYTFSSCILKKDFEPSDELRLFFKPQGESNWTPAFCDTETNGPDYIPLGTQSQWEDRTTIKYDKSSKLLTVTSDKCTSLTVSKNNSVVTTLTGTTGTLQLDVTTLQSGSYTLTLKAGRFSKSITFVL